MKKTKLDLYNAAHAAAQFSIPKTTPYDVEVFALAEFQTQGQDPRDWTQWLQYFNERRPVLTQLSKQYAPSATPAPAPAAPVGSPAAAAPAAS